MRKRLLLTTAVLLSLGVSAFAQKGTVKIEAKGGFSLPEHEKLDMNATGYTLGVNMKYYLTNRLYSYAKVSGTRLTASEKIADLEFNPEEYPLSATKNGLIRDITMGLGIGYDLIKHKKHTLYLQSAFGIGAQYYEKEVIEKYNKHSSLVYDTYSDNSADYALSGDLGYIYSINKLIGVGVSYSADYVCWGFTQSFNANIQFTF